MDGPAGLGEKSARQNVNEHCGELQPRSPPPPPSPLLGDFPFFFPFFPSTPRAVPAPRTPRCLCRRPGAATQRRALLLWQSLYSLLNNSLLH